jgi:hypothetical protein
MERMGVAGGDLIRREHGRYGAGEWRSLFQPQTPKSNSLASSPNNHPDISSLARRGLRKMRKRLPGSLKMGYANYNALVIGFLPN